MFSCIPAKSPENEISPRQNALSPFCVFSYETKTVTFASCASTLVYIDESIIYKSFALVNTYFDFFQKLFVIIS